MASRPPEDDRPHDDSDARTRFFVINATRLIGVALILIGILGLRGKLAFPDPASYAFIAFGLFDFAAMPLILARRWRSPSE
jgi:hypothetical protein